MATIAPENGEIYVRDSSAILREYLFHHGFIYLYDTTPFVITNGHIAANVPCEDNSTASLNVLIGQAPNVTNSELENVPQLSDPGIMCLYHVDIPPQNLRIVNICLYIGNDIEPIPVYTTIC